MENLSLFKKGHTTIHFNQKGCHGKVKVKYGVNTNPIKAGFDSLANLNFDINLCTGYPMVHAYIDSFEGSGYRMLCGWIQVVTSVYTESTEHENNSTEIYVTTDVIPAFQEFEIPFLSYGISPQLFDAPCMNLGKYAELKWTADSYLTSIPTRSRDEEISWLLGFRWGYIENNIANEKPQILPLEITGVKEWNEITPFLRKNYSSWEFLDY